MEVSRLKARHSMNANAKTVIVSNVPSVVRLFQSSPKLV